MVSDLLVRVDIWALFGSDQQSISALPDQIAVVVESQQSRIQMTSQINTLLEDAKQAKQGERTSR